LEKLVLVLRIIPKQLHIFSTSSDVFEELSPKRGEIFAPVTGGKFFAADYQIAHLTRS
jgi:hypothetical protein